MKIKYLFFFLFSVLIGCEEKKYNLYSCEGGSFSEQCSQQCKIKKDFESQFLIDKSSNSISEIIFYKGKKSGSITTKNCIIFDEKNWDCSSENIDVSTKKTTKMANGIYSDYTTYGSKTSDEGICAK